MSRLTNHEKLALMLTAVGSQRRLAEFMGVSHQRLGRWLKEGQPGGIKRIPSDEFTQAGIDAVFQAYKDVSKANAKELGVPYDPNLPLYYHRPNLSRPDPKTGEFRKGDRVIINDTQFINSELRARIITSLHSTDKYLAFSARSLVNLYKYNNRAEVEMRGSRRTEQQRLYRKEFRALLKEAELNGIEKNTVRKHIFTKMEDIRGFADLDLVINNIDRKLRQKHEPATGDPGTRLADAYLLQLKPATPAKPAKSDAEKRSPSVKPIPAKVSRRRNRTSKRR